MKNQTPTNVIVVIGAGSLGQAIARRVSAGKHVLLADLRQENADAAAKTLSEAGFNVTTATLMCHRALRFTRSLRRPRPLARFLVSSTQPGFPLPKRHRKQS